MLISQYLEKMLPSWVHILSATPICRTNDKVKEGILVTHWCVYSCIHFQLTAFSQSDLKPWSPFLGKGAIMRLLMNYSNCDFQDFSRNLIAEDLCLALTLTYIPGTGLHPLKHTPENSNSSQLELPAIFLVITKWNGSSQEKFKKTYGMTDDASHQESQGQVNPPLPENIQT